MLFDDKNGIHITKMRNISQKCTTYHKNRQHITKVQPPLFDFLGFTMETKTCTQLFGINSPLELSIQLLCKVDLQSCDVELRQFLFKLQEGVNTEAEICMKDCTDDRWLVMLGKTYNLKGVEACLTCECEIPLLINAKRAFRNRLKNVWNALNFTGVNEGFAKWEMKVIKDQEKMLITQKVMTVTQMLESVKIARANGMSYSDIRENFNKVMQSAGMSQDTIKELLDVVIPHFSFE